MNASAQAWERGMCNQSVRVWRTTRAATLKNARRSRFPRQRRNFPWQGEVSDPAGDVVGQGGGVPHAHDLHAAATEPSLPP